MQIKDLCSKVSTSTMAIIGAAAFVLGVSLDLSDLGGAIRQLGALILVGVLVKSCIRPALKPQTEAFERGLQQGLDQGWALGYREARPVLVPIRSDIILPAQPVPAHSATFLDVHTASS